MSTELLDQIALWLIIASLPAVNIFTLVYGFCTRWWETLPGRALLVKSISTLLLVDLSALVRWVEIDLHTAAYLRVTIFGLIFLGVSGMCWALLREQGPRFWRWFRDRRTA